MLNSTITHRKFSTSTCEGNRLPLKNSTVEPRLIELDHGTLDGRYFKDALREYGDFFSHWRHDPTSVVLPGGEAFETCAVVSNSTELGQQHQGSVGLR